MQSAADSALLAGVVAAKAELDRGNSETIATEAAKSVTTSLFQSNFSNTGTNLTASFTVSGLTITGALTATYSHPTHFKGVLGVRDLPIQVSSQTQATVEPYVNVYLLIDISASMLLPATSTGINQMITGTGCALACHDRTDGKDTFSYAVKNNILMRYQVVNQGIDNLLTYLKSRQTVAGRVRVELWSFDHDMRKLVPLTSDMARVSSNFPAPALASSEEAAATHFDRLINTFVESIGTSGAGTSQVDAKKLVMIATDGVSDPTRAWTSNVSLRSQVKVFDTAFCTTLKDRGNTVAIINTPYLPMTWDWGYNATLGKPGSRGGATRVDDIPIVLRQCAGRYFTIASDVQAIRAAFIDIFTAAMPVRLMK